MHSYTYTLARTHLPTYTHTHTHRHKHCIPFIAPLVLPNFLVSVTAHSTPQSSSTIHATLCLRTYVCIHLWGYVWVCVFVCMVVCACVVYVYMCSCVDYDQVVYGSVNSKGGSMRKFWGHASSSPPMVVNADHWGSPFTFYGKSDTFCSRIFIVISHSHFLAGTWFETGGLFDCYQ